jgi:hypothetical protein
MYKTKPKMSYPQIFAPARRARHDCHCTTIFCPFIVWWRWCVCAARGDCPIRCGIGKRWTRHVRDGLSAFFFARNHTPKSWFQLLWVMAPEHFFLRFQNGVLCLTPPAFTSLTVVPQNNNNNNNTHSDKPRDSGIVTSSDKAI